MATLQERIGQFCISLNLIFDSPNIFESSFLHQNLPKNPLETASVPPVPHVLAYSYVHVLSPAVQDL